jgi:hypothetical protein
MTDSNARSEADASDRAFALSWGMVDPTDEEAVQVVVRRRTHQGVDSMLVWTLWPEVGHRITDHLPHPTDHQVRTAPSGWVSVRFDATQTVEDRRQLVGLPLRPFLYTIDQIAQMVQVTIDTVPKYLHFAGVSPGKCPEDKMLASNLGRPGEPADWRVADAELVRWLRLKGFKVYDAFSLELP